MKRLAVFKIVFEELDHGVEVRLEVNEEEWNDEENAKLRHAAQGTMNLIEQLRGGS